MSIQAQNTELNIVPGGIIPVVHVSQYDVDRVLTFNLYDRNSEASLASGTTAVIEGTKPDGNGFQYAATISGNTVTVNTTIQMTVLSGTVDCKIVLRNGSQVIGTALFIMDVEKAGINENTPMSETDLPLIISEATEQMERAEAAATAAALSEENAEAEALKAEGYATGKQNGEEVSSESLYYHNNAEYYAEYAESIAESLPDGLNIKGTCTFAELPSIADSFVGDTWVISDSFTTTSDFRSGSGVSVPSGAYVYLTDSNKWDILPSKSGGHMIVDSEGVTMPQRAKLKFVNATVTDDSTNDTTIIEAEGGGSSVVASLAITTNNSAFYGKTVTVKDSNGDTVNTGVFSNSGTVSIGVVGANYYTVSVTAYGATVSQQVAVTESGSYNVALNSDTILGAWIDKGGLDYTDYANFAAVEADEEAVRRLMTIHASVDYLAECGSATDSLVLSIINSDICAKWINLRDYALDTLYANTYLKAMMDTADKYFYGEWVITDNTTTPPTWGAKGNVPVMTADDAPYGETNAYQAFNNNTSVAASITVGDDIGRFYYKFTNPVCVKKFYCKDKVSTGGSQQDSTFKIQASNDGTTWVDLTDSYAISASSIFEESHEIDNDNYYLYYALTYSKYTYINSSNAKVCYLAELQFYGRELKESVPTMTSNTAPYGVASGISVYSSDYAVWKAFNPSEAKGWTTAAGTGGQGNHPWIKYEFPTPVSIRMAFGKGVGTHASEWSTWKLEGSNDDTNYTEILSELKIYYGSTWSNASFSNGNSYKYYRLTGLDTSTSFSKDDGNKFQFYGLNYTEYDWDVSHPRKYLYDHGLKFNSSIFNWDDSRPNAYEYRSDEVYLKSTQQKSGSIYYERTSFGERLDITSYKTFRGILGSESYSPYIYDPGIMINDTTGTQGTQSYCHFVKVKDGALDISSVNGNYWVVFGVYDYNDYSSITELWLE